MTAGQRNSYDAIYHLLDCYGPETVKYAMREAMKSCRRDRRQAERELNEGVVKRLGRESDAIEAAYQADEDPLNLRQNLDE